MVRMIYSALTFWSMVSMIYSALTGGRIRLWPCTCMVDVNVKGACTSMSRMYHVHCHFTGGTSWLWPCTCMVDVDVKGACISFYMMSYSCQGCMHACWGVTMCIVILHDVAFGFDHVHVKGVCTGLAWYIVHWHEVAFFVHCTRQYSWLAWYIVHEHGVAFGFP